MNETTPEPTGQPPADRGRAEPVSLAGRGSRAAGLSRPRPREITVPALIRTVRDGLWLLLAVIALAVLLTALDLKRRVPQYTATMTVAPAELDLTSAGQLAGELQFFAALPSAVQSEAKLDRYAQLFDSTALAERLLAESQQLLQLVFVDEWDPERQTWHPPPGLTASLQRAVLGFFGYPAWSQPDAGRLAEWLGREIVVSRLPRSSLLEIEITDPHRAFAVSLLDQVHRAADQLLREAALDQVGSQIAQLESELAKTTVPARQEALEAMLAEQYRTRALFQAEQPYAAQVVVPAMASQSPTSFDPIVMLVLAAVIGAILGLFIIFLRDALRSPEP